MNNFFQKQVNKEMPNPVYIFENPSNLKLESSDADLTDLFIFMKSLENEHFNPKIIKQVVSFGLSFSISINENIFISSLLPSKKITDSIFNLMNITNPMRDVLNYLSLYQIKTYNLRTLLDFRNKIESIDDIKYYEINVNATLFNKINNKKPNFIRLRHYFNTSEIPEDYSNEILIINNNDHKKFIHENLNIKYSLEIPYSEINYHYLTNLFKMDII